MNAETPPLEALQLWRLSNVIEEVGLSKTEIYRRMKDVDPHLNPFPRNYPYRNNRQARFWRSDEVNAWKWREVGVEPDPLPQPQPTSDPLAGLIG